MALPAIQVRQLDVGGVREVDIFGLARIDLPGYLAAGRHIAVDETLLLGGCAHGHIRRGEAFHRRLCDARPRDTLASLFAPARKCLLLARRPHQAGAPGLPAMPWAGGPERHPR